MADHAVLELIDTINESHPGLGELAAMCVVTMKARQCLLVVAPPGCGKSTVGNWIVNVHPEAYWKQSITRSSLKIYVELFNDFEGGVVFDDMGAIDTEWSRMQTLVTMVELVYGHKVSKDSHQLHIEIDNFFGSAILNVQPNVLKEVVGHGEWHANVADKSLRYYHLKRATMPNPGPIEAELDWGLPWADVDAYSGESPTWDAIKKIGMEQWTLPRCLEHTQGLLKAVAALDNNPSPGQMELDILLNLMRPMTVEMDIIEKQGFGSKAILNDNLLYLLVQFASYPDVTYERFAQDYKMKPTQVQVILSHMVDWYEKVGNNPVKLQKSERLDALLKKAGIR